MREKYFYGFIGIFFLISCSNNTSNKEVSLKDTLHKDGSAKNENASGLQACTADHFLDFNSSSVENDVIRFLNSANLHYAISNKASDLEMFCFTNSEFICDSATNIIVDSVHLSNICFPKLIFRFYQNSIISIEGVEGYRNRGNSLDQLKSLYEEKYGMPTMEERGAFHTEFRWLNPQNGIMIIFEDRKVADFNGNQVVVSDFCFLFPVGYKMFRICCFSEPSDFQKKKVEKLNKI